MASGSTPVLTYLDVRSAPGFASAPFSRRPESFLSRHLASVAVLIGLSAAPAFAQEGYCSGVIAFGEESAVRLMRVESAAPRVHFIESRSKEKPSCPSEADACKRKGFVVPGDVVLAPVQSAPVLCTSYIAPGAKRVKGTFTETSGYLLASVLKDVPASASKPDEWIGQWSRSAEAEITISATSGGKLKVAGTATFGALDPSRVKRGAVNMGELEGERAPKGHMLALGEGYDGSKPFGDDRGECRAKLRLFGRYLVVEDNGGCGGLNVSFTGIYVRLAQ